MTIINEENVNRGNAQKIKPWDYGVAKHACLDLRAVAADTGYIIVDLSDTSGFPHRNDAAVILNSLHVEAEVLSSGVFSLLFGVLTEVDATNGSVSFFERIQMESAAGAIISLDKFWRAGLNLRVLADESTPYLVTGLKHTANTTWQTDTALANPTGVNVAPASGDLVMFIDEVSGSGNINAFVEAEYDAI